MHTLISSSVPFIDEAPPRMAAIARTGNVESDCDTDPVRVLVVEDEVRLSAALKRGLEAEGFTVDVAANGSHRPDLGKCDKNFWIWPSYAIRTWLKTTRWPWPNPVRYRAERPFSRWSFSSLRDPRWRTETLSPSRGWRSGFLRAWGACMRMGWSTAT